MRPSSVACNRDYARTHARMAPRYRRIEPLNATGFQEARRDLIFFSLRSVRERADFIFPSPFHFSFYLIHVRKINRFTLTVLKNMSIVYDYRREKYK